MSEKSRISRKKRSVILNFKAGDLIVIAATVIISLALLSRVFLFNTKGSQADIFANGEKVASVDLKTGKLVYRSSGINKAVEAFSVTTEDNMTIIRITSSGIHAVIKCFDGRIRFAESDCPDRVCVNTGYISVNRQASACVPAGLLISITGESSESDPDIIIG